MAAFKCKMCGGNLEIVEGMTVCECEYCGIKQTVPNANDEKKINLFNRANRLRSACEFDKAATIYESIVSEFFEEAEAYWGLCLCKFGIEYVDDPKTAKKIPTCHRTSYSSIFDDGNFELACEYADSVALQIYRSEAKEIDRLQKEILNIAKNEEPFDIFICYKESDENGQRTVDSELAHDLYDVLTEKGYKVFYSRITLKAKLGQDYEPYIFSALNSAKVMLAVGTKYEYYNAVWVKNEWSRFLALMENDKGKTLIPCYKNIDAYDIPKDFNYLQAQDLSSPRSFQDLIDNIEKIIPNNNTGSSNLTNESQNNQALDEILKNADIFLKSKQFNSAYKCYNQALTLKPDCGKAYVGLLMVEKGISDVSDIERYTFLAASLDNDLYDKIRQFGSEQDKEILERFIKATKVYEGLALVNLSSDKTTIVGSVRVDVEVLDLTKLPPCVTKIGKRAFKGHGDLKKIILPNSIVEIEDDAFRYCRKIKYISFPDSLRIIGDGAFYDTGLKTIVIPENTQIIGESAFEIGSLTTLIIKGGNVKLKIDSSNIFKRSHELKHIVIPDRVENIYEVLKNIPKSVEYLNVPDSWYYKLVKTPQYEDIVTCPSRERKSRTSLAEYLDIDIDAIIAENDANKPKKINNETTHSAQEKPLTSSDINITSNAPMSTAAPHPTQVKQTSSAKPNATSSAPVNTTVSAPMIPTKKKSKKPFLIICAIIIVIIVIISNQDNTDYVKKLKNTAYFYNSFGYSCTMQNVVNKYVDSPTWLHYKSNDKNYVKVSGTIDMYDEDRKFEAIFLFTPNGNGTHSVELTKGYFADGDCDQETMKQVLVLMFDAYDKNYTTFEKYIESN